MSLDTSIDKPFAPIRTYQDIVAGMCRNILSRHQKVNQKYRDSGDSGLNQNGVQVTIRGDRTDEESQETLNLRNIQSSQERCLR